MLSSLKKPSDKSSSVTVPAWHPNFRNFERLPDTKVVRTSFFVNGIAVFIAFALLLYFGYREYGLQTMNAETEAASSSIAANKVASAQAVAQFRKFQEEEKKVQALQQFLAPSRLVFSDFVLLVGSTLPPATIITNIDYRKTGVMLKGGISGASEEASGQAVVYVESLKKNDLFSMFDITLTNIVRDTATGQIRFQIDLKFKAATKTAVEGKK